MYEMSALFLWSFPSHRCLKDILQAEGVGARDFNGQLSCYLQLCEGVCVIVVVKIANRFVEMIIHLL